MKKSIFTLFFSLFGLMALLGQPLLEIWEIQGKSNVSPYTNMVVRAERNIVTLVAGNHFFMQTPEERSDEDPLTSDGIRVWTGSRPTVQEGSFVSITGRVSENNGNTEFQSSGLSLEIIPEQVNIPNPIVLGDAFPLGLPQNIAEYEQVEGMLVDIPAGTTTGPTFDDYTPMTAKSTRLFRESGIQYPGRSGLPVWDGNPELLYLNLTYAPPQNPDFFSGGKRIKGKGVILHSGSRYEFRPYQLELDGSPVERAVRDRKDREVSVGSLNALFLDASASSFSIRRRKMARFIVNILKAPDILAMQEVTSVTSLEQLCEEIKSIAPQVEYTAYLRFGSGSIHTGFLVRKTVTDVSVRQLGGNQFLSIGGRMHDRPPLLLEGFFNTPSRTPIKVLNLHMRSLRGIEGSDQSFVRTKRFEQAISVASMVQSLRTDNLIVIGDYNAYEFTDGYVDVMSIISGQSSLGAERTTAPVVSPPLQIHTATIDPLERYSFVFQGNAQLLDHVLSNELTDIKVNGLEFARGNADNSERFFTNSSNLHRVSDHDAPVLFLELDDLPSTQTNGPASAVFALNYPSPFRAEQVVQLILPKEELINFYLIAMDGRLAYQRENLALSKGVHEFKLPEQLAEGVYVIRVRGAKHQQTGKVFISQD